ncbi:MAG TPA: hypothetical protein VLJ88_00475 [Propionibacteriaceae bacterium]|nr:hypothetical protein [Propionibacteriaceae bacterium]
MASSPWSRSAVSGTSAKSAPPTETRTRLTEATERATDLEGVRLDTAAAARRLVAALQGRLAADPA